MYISEKGFTGRIHKRLLQLNHDMGNNSLKKIKISEQVVEKINLKTIKQ